MYRKRSRRRRRERSGDESKAAIDGDGGETRTGAGDVVGGCVDGDVTGEIIGGGTGGGGGDHHHHRTETVDDGLENNPDIIPHDNGE